MNAIVNIIGYCVMNVCGTGASRNWSVCGPMWGHVYIQYRVERL